MASSLKATFPALTRIVGYTPAALYARQRAYVDAGLLESTPGRGPGSGVKASPETLSQFIIALIAEATLDKNVEFAKGLARAKAAGGKCALTGTATFKEAFAAILSDKALRKRVTEMRIVTNGGEAEIKHDGSISKFLDKAIDKEALTIQVAISPDILRKLANVLTETGQ